MVIGSWMLDVGCWKLEVRSLRLEKMYSKPQIQTLRSVPTANQPITNQLITNQLLNQ